jgi:hypothetical protein
MTSQRRPFQDSTRVSDPNAPSCDPAATQLAAPRHVTPSRTLFVVRLGLGTTDQVFPFQDSTNVTVPRLPTATHLVALRQDTPYRSPSRENLRVGVNDQAFPFQISARGSSLNDFLGLYLPTAAQNDELVQDTAFRTSRRLCAVPPGLGLGMIDQVCPFQAVARVQSSPP